MTHPFHPWSGREFGFVALQQTWRQDRVYFFGDDGTMRSLPTAWTDAAERTCLSACPQAGALSASMTSLHWQKSWTASAEQRTGNYL